MEILDIWVPNTCMCYGQLLKSKSYETLFTYLFSNFVCLFYANKGKLMLRVYIWTRPNYDLGQNILRQRQKYR